MEQTEDNPGSRIITDHYLNIDKVIVGGHWIEDVVTVDHRNNFFSLFKYNYVRLL